LHLFYEPEITDHLSPDESRHAVKVLRLVQGDPIEITNGKGKICEATLTASDSKKCSFKITASSQIPRRDFSIHLAIAPTKNMDRMEWLVEKCVEMGIEKISFLHCKTSERKVISLERIGKIVVSAMKQSRQFWLPEINPMEPFPKFIETVHAGQKFIAHVDHGNPHHLQSIAKSKGEYLILIGPEGDFSVDEIHAALKDGFQKVSLGPNRLRTETAGLSACHILNLINA
jgi:16S rRNA (uracil1498-N3)-methyltransferase